MPDQVISDNFKTLNSVEVKNCFVKHGVKQSFIFPALRWQAFTKGYLISKINITKDFWKIIFDIGRIANNTLEN